MSESRPSSAGTIPDAIGDPLDGGQVDVETFNFPSPNGEVDPGPLGALAHSQADLPPLLGWARQPGGPRQRSFESVAFGTFARVEIARPTVFLAIATNFGGPGSGDTLVLDYFPEEEPRIDAGFSQGLPSARAGIYCWAPGTWWIGVHGPVGLGQKITLQEIPAEDRTVAEQLLNPRSAPERILSAADAVIPAAAATEVYDLDQSIRGISLRMQNVGANPLRYTFGGNTPTATAGIQLAVGEQVFLEGLAFPMARVRVFSTLGTSVAIQTGQRFQFLL